MGSNGDQVEIGSQVEKRRPGRKKEARKKKMAEKGPKKFSRFMRHFPTTGVNKSLGEFVDFSRR